jgi:hypothetical protein
MKVFIGPYEHWFRPARWYKNFILWRRGFGRGVDADKFDIDAYDELTEKIHDSRIYNALMAVERWINDRYERRIDVKLRDYDIWSMDDTLGHIILPMLKLLREKKHGYPHVEDKDVPEHLRSTAAPPLTQEQINIACPDDNGAPRWDWVMNEMIWAFEQQDPDADDGFFAGGYDHAGHMSWQERKTRGFVLFGKYFQALWD